MNPIDPVWPATFGSLIPIAGIVMVIFIVWFDSRRKEREAFHRNELLKKIAESQGDAADKVLEMMRHEEAEAKIRRREGLKLGGLITSAAGLGIMALLYMLVPSNPVWITGAIPLLIGLALVVFVLMIHKPEQ